MKILFLTSTLPRFDGDQQAPFVLHQAKAWKRARPADDVLVLAPHDVSAAAAEVKSGVIIHRFHYFWPRKYQRLAYPAILPNLRRNRWLFLQLPFFLAAEYWHSYRFVCTHKIDVVYAHWVMPQGLIAYLLHKRTGVPFVIQNHSSDLSVFKSFIFGRYIAIKIVESAKVFFCVNREQLNDAMSLFDSTNQMTISEKCFVYPMGVSIPGTKVNQGMVESRQAGRCIRDFGVMSRLSKKKGIEYFIAALEMLGSKGVNYQAGIAGDGEYANELHAAGARCDVEFLGFLNGDDKAEFIRTTRFFVFPSVADGQDVEGMPVAILEAMYCGKLIIASTATNITLLPEWDDIKNGVFLLEDVRDAEQFSATLERLLALPNDEIERMSTALRIAIGKYDWDKLIESYIKPVARLADVS